MVSLKYKKSGTLVSKLIETNSKGVMVLRFKTNRPIVFTAVTAKTQTPVYLNREDEVTFIPETLDNYRPKTIVINGAIGE